MSLGPQFDQLQMFMTGSELKSYLTDSGDRGGGSMEGMWGQKLKEAQHPAGAGDYKVHGEGLYDSIKERGYQGDSLGVNHWGGEKSLLDGHHRVAAAAQLDSEGYENYIPVTHWGDDS